jgi:hypothetical protein
MSNEVTKATIVDGVNPKMSNEEYHGNRSHVSSSGLKMMLKDPRQFYLEYVKGERSDEPHPNQAAFDFGSYVHALILEPEVLDDEFAIFNGAMKRGKVWEEFKENVDPKKIIISQSQVSVAKPMLAEYNRAVVKIGDTDVKIASFFEEGAAEETYGAEINGVKVKVRTDYRNSDAGFISDIKTTSERTLNKKNIENICKRFGYHISAALYVDVVTQITGKEHDFYFCFLSKSSGDCAIFKASAQMLEKGREEYKEAIKLLRNARESGVYWEHKVEEINYVE